MRRALAVLAGLLFACVSGARSQPDASAEIPLPHGTGPGITQTAQPSRISTFGSAGIVSFGFNNPAITRDPTSNDLLIAGTFEPHQPAEPPYLPMTIGVARLDAKDGAPRMDFGAGGLVQHTFMDPSMRAEFVMLAPDSRILVAGLTTSVEVAFARLNADGSLDESFGQGGQVLRPEFGASVPRRVIPRTDGSGFLVFETSGDAYPERDLVVGALQWDGRLDAAFGAEGLLRVALSSTNGEPGLVDAAICGDGDIALLSVESPDEGAVIRVFRSDGAPQTSFGIDGKVALGTDLFAYESISCDASNRLVVMALQAIGFSGSDEYVAVRRFLPSGEGDPSFDEAAHFPFGFFNWQPQAVFQRSGGDLVVVGSQQGYAALGHLSESGEIDHRFGSPDIWFDALLTGGSIREDVHDSMLLGDDRLVVTGSGSDWRSYVLEYSLP